MNFVGCPPADLAPSMQENFEEADHTRVMDFDARITDRADGNRQGDALQEGKIDVDVEPFGLEASEAADDRLELVAGMIKIVQPFLDSEVVEVVGAQFVAQERQEL